MPQHTDRPKALFTVSMDVRDYECDLQGIVNNAVYQNYLEHARHLFLGTIGLDFAGLHDQGIDPVVTRAEIDYKLPLTSGDRFAVAVSLARKGRLRFIFHQEIRRTGTRGAGQADATGGVASSDAEPPAGELAVVARIVAVATAGGRPVDPGAIIDAVERTYGRIPTE